MSDVDLGSLFVKLKAYNNDALKAIKEYEEAIVRSGQTTKTVGTEIKEVYGAMGKVASQMSSGFNMAFTGISTTFNALLKTTNAFFYPLKILTASFLAVKGTIYSVGLAAIKTAGDFDILYRKLEITLGKERVPKVWKESLQMAGYFDVDSIMNAASALESVGIKGSQALKTVSDAAIMLNLDIQEVSRSIMRMSAGTLRGVRLMGIDFEIIGKTYYFRYWNKGQEIIEKAVGVIGAQTKLMEILSAKFGGATDSVSKSITGLFKTIKTFISEVLQDIGDGMRPITEKLLEDFKEIIIQSSPLMKKLGIQMGGSLVEFRASFLATFKTALEIAKKISDILGEEKGKAKVLQEGVKLAGSILGEGFLTVIRASISIWKVIGSIFANAVLETLYNSGLPFAKSIGSIKHARDLQQTFAGLDKEQLSKIAHMYGVPLIQSTPITGMMPSASPIIIEKDITTLRSDIIHKLRLKSQEDIENEVQKISKALGIPLKYEPYGNLDKALNNLVIETKQTFSDFKNFTIDNVQKFADRLGISENIGDTWNTIYAQEKQKGLEVFQRGLLEDIRRNTVEEPVESVFNKPSSVSYNTSLLNQPYNWYRDLIERTDISNIMKNNVYKQVRQLYSLEEIASGQGPFPDTNIQTIMALVRESKRELDTVRLTKEEKEKIVQLDRFRQVLEEGLLGTSIEQAREQLKQLKALEQTEQTMREVFDFETKIMQYDILLSQMDAMLSKLEQEKKIVKEIEEAREKDIKAQDTIRSFRQEAMSPYEKWQQDVDELAKAFEEFYGMDWMEYDPIVEEYNSIVDALKKKHFEMTKRDAGGDVKQYDTRYINADALAGEDLQSQQLAVLKQIARNTKPVPIY